VNTLGGQNVKTAFYVAMLACLCLIGERTASAQFWGVNVPIGKSVGISVGNTPAAGYGYGGYGYGYGRPGYYPPPVVIAPAPVQRHYHHTHVVTPSYSQAVSSPAYSSTTTIQSSVPQNVAKPKTYSGGPIVISNPADSGQALSYLLNGYEYTIQPGHEQKFNEDRDWSISFGSGGSLGNVQYTLHEGNYQFSSTKEGWDLIQKQPPQNVAKQ
jgi:hypothetical protein